VYRRMRREAGGRVLAGKLSEHVAGGDEADRVATSERVQRDVLENHRLANAIGSDDHGVVPGLDAREGEQLFDGLSVDPFRPGPVEVGHGFRGADAGVAGAALEAAFLALALFDGEDFAQPGLIDDFVAAGDEAEQAESLEACLQLGGSQLSGHGHRLS
jgi:hypothetical protein